MPHKDANAEQHKTTLAVWDVASPLVSSRAARLKVGAKCSAGCELTGKEIEIHDDTGRTLARAGLSAEPWPGTSGLYWVEVDFLAPAVLGTHVCTVTCPHGDASSEFTFITVPPPEHTLAIMVRAKDTKAPLPDVEVRLGVYRATSDDRGLAKVELPAGTYTLDVWKLGYEHFSNVLDVTATATVDIEIAVEPEPTQPYWM